jgi:hypothetical protein
MSPARESNSNNTRTDTTPIHGKAQRRTRS